MKLDFINDLVNNLKDSNVVENFMNELSEYLEKNSGNQIDLMSDNLHINGSRVISKYRDIILTERNNILQEYAKNTSHNFFKRTHLFKIKIHIIYVRVKKVEVMK